MAQFSASEIVLIATGVMGGISAAVVAVLTAWRTGAKVDKVAAVIDTVEKNTNSNYARQEIQILQLSEQVRRLTSFIAEQEKTRAVLAAEQGAVQQPTESSIIKP